jgi:hypothetical protein
MRKPRGRHRRCPYYKVQIFSKKVQAWQDEQRAFDTVSDAIAYIGRKVSAAQARIIRVEETSRQIVT